MFFLKNNPNKKSHHFFLYFYNQKSQHEKIILPFLLVLTFSFIRYEHYDEVLIFTKDIVKNPENRILT